MTTANMNESELRQRVSGLLAAGRLPASDPYATWAGSGRGERCYVCHVLVREDEIGFDLAFRTPEREVELHMHSQCRSAWEQVRGQATARIISTTTGAPSGRLVTPATERVDALPGPNTSASNSEAPSATFG